MSECKNEIEQTAPGDVINETLAVPILNVANIKTSIDYYTSSLGFALKWSYGDPVDFACVSLANSEIFLCENGQGHAGTWYYIFIEKVDQYQAYLDDRPNVIFKSRCQIMPWHMKEMHIEDPDGHVIRFGTSHFEES